MKLPKVGIGVAIVRNLGYGEEVLLGRRKGSHGAGEWSFPGGKMDAGEYPAVTAHREVEEEIGCQCGTLHALPFWSFETYPGMEHHFVTLYFKTYLLSGKPQNMEPEKCEEWQWFVWENGLPEPLFAGIEQLRRQVPVFEV